MTYRPTVYEKIVQDFLSGKELNFQDYKTQLAERGWEDKRYFDAYVEDMKYIKSLMDSPDFNLRKAADTVKKNHPSQNKDVLSFSLTDAEKDIVLKAEEMGAVKDGEVITYDGYDKQIVCADYKNLPPQTDALVIFSGHPGAAESAIESWLTDLKNTGKPKKLVFLGLYDNQGNTDFSQSGLKYNTGSEVEMYVRYCRAIGISEEILQQCLVTPNDTSTEDNTRLLAEIRNNFFKDKKDVSFAMFGYPAYQKRIASEFSFAFNQMEKNGEVKSTNFIMPAVPTSKDPHGRYLSYDNLSTIAQDIIIGNCMAHPYRVAAGGRFDSKLGTYPEEFKPLLPLSLVYSYPNVANELAGTDTKVATMMKLLRAIQHDTHKFEDAHVVDRTAGYAVLHFKKNMALKGLLSVDLMNKGNKLSAAEYIREVQKYQKSSTPESNAMEAAKAVMGTTTNERKLQEEAAFLKAAFLKTAKGRNCLSN